MYYANKEISREGFKLTLASSGLKNWILIKIMKYFIPCDSLTTIVVISQEQFLQKINNSTLSDAARGLERADTEIHLLNYFQ